ncbi:MAG: TolC family protein [Deltaproteobacteria bacterium]|nr:TolC family protein [Deltaproteobacteria bacterium]
MTAAALRLCVAAVVVAFAATPARAASEFVEPTGVVTLREAARAALLGNPDLRAFAAEIRARDARAVQAGLPPNPALAAESENLAATRSGAFARAETTVSLAQLLELGGKRAKRRRAALLERDLADWDYESHRALVLSTVTKAFVAALAVQQRLALADELIRIADASVETVGAQVRAGAVSPIEQDRARVAGDRARLERVQLEHEVRAARAELAATWGGSRVAFVGLRGDLAVVAPPPPIEHFLARVEDNPALARWTAELEQRRAALAIERARAIPDLTARVGVRHLNEDDAVAAVAELSFPLPIFDRNQGGIAEAGHRVAKAEAERAAAEAAVRSTLARAYETLHAAFDQVVTLRDAVIPRAEAVFRGVQGNYARGLFRYLEVLDAQRTLFELRGQYLQTLATYHGALAEVERVSGAAVVEPAPGRETP